MTVADATPQSPAVTDSAIILAPVGRDAAVLCKALGSGGIHCSQAGNLEELVAFVRGGIDVVIVTEEALAQEGAAELLDAINEQPPWSDLPVLLLLRSGDGRTPVPGERVAELCASASVTILVRPVPSVSLVSAVQAAIRARRRQYEVRNLVQRERTARVDADRANQLKDVFLAMVSHELRTPLSAILLWSHLLTSGGIDASRTKEALHVISSSAKSQSQLIEDLLDVSRMVSGNLRLNLQDMSLASVIDEAVAIVRPAATARKVELTSSIGPLIGAIRADPGRVQQVLWNLLSNAIKFTPAGGQVKIVSRCDRHNVTIRVSDTGQGIAPEFLPHVFERFRQADIVSTRPQGGLGLGLTISQQLVELHGGSIAVSSPGLGQGATFEVSLPLSHH